MIRFLVVADPVNPRLERPLVVAHEQRHDEQRGGGGRC